ncbi:MAG: hypothetical protein KAR39_08360 [Thermoplasmata archaeon]|nr:hypothetical protein [Thermoplasmata archaeon]
MRAASHSWGKYPAVGLTILIVLSTSGLLSFNAVAQPGAWEDLFDDQTKISQQANVVVAGGDVSLDANRWDWYRYGVQLDKGPSPGTFESSLYLSVVKGSDNIYRMWYTGTSGSTMLYIRYATSADGRSWSRMGIVIGANTTQEDRVFAPYVIEDAGIYKMWYVGDDLSPPYGSRIFYATSPDGYTWTRQGKVIDLGLEGTYDTVGVSFQSVLKDGATYKMWYSGYNGNWRLLYATSPDGTTWTAQGLAIDIGLPGEYDSASVIESTVTKDLRGLYHCWYTGSDAANYRILNATSTDGIIWTKHGLSLDILPNSLEESKVLSGTVMIDATDVITMWYGAVDGSGDGRVLLAIYGRNGYVISEEIGPNPGYSWVDFFSNKTEPNPDMLVTYSILDGLSMTTVSGYQQMSASQFSLLSIDPMVNPTIRIRADLWDLINNSAQTPLLHDYAVTWDDVYPPVFGGLLSATDDGTDGDITLNWNAAWDPNPPITYNIYMATVSSGQNFFVPDYSTSLTTFQVSGLLNGTGYYFVVRAEDSWGFEDTNMVERSVIPTTPLDYTAPVFGGLTSATDSGTGGSVTLNWTAASDPDTPESNSDPSSPISYNIYYSEPSGGQDFFLPNATTQNTNYEVTGLTNGNTYYFVVRAEDAAGNEETNSVEMSAIPTTPIDSNPPSFAGLATATNLGTGGNVRLTWAAAVDPDTPECNSDPSLPITYNIYYSKIPSGQDFMNPNATTQLLTIDITGLTNGIPHYFVVRARDSVLNQELNTVEESAIPTPPVDDTPPNFGGITSAFDSQIDGIVTLMWSPATDPDTAHSNSDPSLPITYLVYLSTTSGDQNFLLPITTTQLTQIEISGLQNGVTHYFVVRARDSAGNQETNTIEASAMPTTAVDNTPPTFAGIVVASDAESGGAVDLFWAGATDPDTIECNSDPSTPIVYNIYVSESPTTFDFIVPTATTGLTQYTFSGLERGVEYFFIVRAEDAAGNEETNTVTKSAELAEQEEEFNFLDYWWIFLVLIIVLLIVVIILLSRKKKEEEPPVEAKPESEMPEEEEQGEASPDEEE